MTDIDLARFACRLASEGDVTALKARHVDTLWSAYRRAIRLPVSHGIGVGRGPAADAFREQERDYQARLVAAIQLIARELLDAACGERPVSASFNGETRIVDGEKHYSGDPVEIFAFMLAAALAPGPLRQRVRKCPECGRFFVRVRRQLYCSDKCTDRATWRNYPESKKRRSRAKQYQKNGWELGARTRKGRR